MHIYATTPEDGVLDRTPPDITDLVTKAVARYRNTDPDFRNPDAVIDTELNAVAEALRIALQPSRAVVRSLDSGTRSEDDDAS